MTTLPCIPGYTVIRYVAEGASGCLYEAIQDDVGRRLALKIGKSIPGTDDSVAKEVAKLAKLNHPNVVVIYNAGIAPQADGSQLPYIAMEFLEGGTLRETFIHARSQQTLRDNLRCFLELLHAVQHAHSLAIYHSDLHEGNLLLTRSNQNYRVKIVDFGFPSSRALANLHDRIVQDEEQLRRLFWAYFYFPNISSQINQEEFDRLNLQGMIQYVSELTSARLNDQILLHDNGRLARRKEERARRFAKLAFFYALDHPMKKNITVSVMPYLGSDIMVERQADTYLFAISSWASVGAAGYLFLLLSLSEIMHQDYGLAPSETTKLSAHPEASPLCEAFLGAWRIIKYFSEIERMGFLQPTILKTMPDVFARCLEGESLNEAMFLAIVYNSILLRYKHQPIELSRRALNRKQMETVTGLAYLLARLPWSHLLRPRDIRRILQLVLDRFAPKPYATILLHEQEIAVVPVTKLTSPNIQVNIDVDHGAAVPIMKCSRRAGASHLYLTVNEGMLAQWYGLSFLEREARHCASQFFESPDASILARHGIGLYCRIGDCWFMFAGKEHNDEAYLRFRESVRRAVQNLGRAAQDTAVATASNALKAELDFYSENNVITITFGAVEYESRHLRVANGYGMVILTPEEGTKPLTVMQDHADQVASRIPQMFALEEPLNYKSNEANKK